MNDSPEAPTGVLALSVAIPTFGREKVLVETLQHVLRLTPAPAEVLVMDQTPTHDPDTDRALSAWADRGAIRWVRLSRPSIPQAMNRALLEARSPLVLFLDDDVVPQRDLVERHRANYADGAIWSVVGQVLQPGQQPERNSGRPRGAGLRRDLEFRFNTTERTEIANCIACNWSVRREEALRTGGFDENFVGVAYRFETEFARRLEYSGGKTLFEPLASLHHLAAPRGGTRAYGCHLRSARPEHGVGDYYFALRYGRGLESFRYITYRALGEVRTRYHLRHPWWIPVKLLGEFRALLWAVRLARQGPRLVALEK